SAIVAEGGARLWLAAGVSRIRRRGSRRLPACRGRVARSGGAGALELLAASHGRACHGDDRATGRRARLDERARGIVVDAGAYEPGAYLVAQGAVPCGTRPVRRGAGAL